METDLVSIIVPVYDAEQFLDRCIESALHQTYQNLEIVLVDDGSPDRCGDICDRHAKEDNRIVVIHQENAGPSAARNTGLDAAKGDFIYFLNSDDYIDLNTISVLVDTAKNEDVILLFPAIIGWNLVGKFVMTLRSGQRFIQLKKRDWLCLEIKFPILSAASSSVAGFGMIYDFLLVLLWRTCMS